MSIIDLFENYGMVGYAIFIFFGGHWGIKNFDVFKRKTHNFLLFATVAAILFLVLEFAADRLEWVDAAKYALTYTVVTSCYENVVDLVPFLKKKKENTNQKTE